MGHMLMFTKTRPSLLILLSSSPFILRLSFCILSSSPSKFCTAVFGLGLQLRLVTPPTFHPFSRLPPELRLKIWKAAWPRSSRFEGGLQYVTVDTVNTEDSWREDYIHPVTSDPNLEHHDYDYAGRGYVTMRALECPWGKTGNSPSPVNPLNKSAYLWDAGLWLACKESREVVSEHSHSKEWLACREEPLRRDEPVWYGEAFHSAIVPQNKNEQWCPLVKPYGDMFCIDTSNLESVPEYSLDMMLLAPFFGTKKFTVVGEWNIAFKFDPSWNNNFPSSWSDLMRLENSVRSRLAISLFYVESAVSAFPYLWLIDDNLCWNARSRRENPSVWRDLEDEYVEIYWDQTRSSLVDGTQGAVIDFLNSLQQLSEKCDHFCDSASCPIRLLVRRKNQLPGLLTEVFDSDNEDGDDSEDDSEGASSNENDGCDNSDEGDE
ncbi:tetracycline resistance [Fusarium mundagurra]|uniref:Tetracycline resistance n=1 Tax=Fusarium mundagurra TaxID=1567541 RepID=A0A8H6DI19_9HYPO|nr:tetracycline resistance [Fusarium mundagurra]